MRDKPFKNMIQTLSGKNRTFIFTKPKTHRSADPRILAGIRRQSGVVENVREAVLEAKRLAGPAGLVVVAGSFYTVGEARPEIKKGG